MCHHVCIILNVEDEDGVGARGEDGGNAAGEERQQRREETLLGHVLKPHSDAAGQHGVCDDGDTQRALGIDAVDAVCMGERRKEKMKREGKRREEKKGEEKRRGDTLANFAWVISNASLHCTTE